MTQRVKWLDAAKGAAIALVVLGHSLNGSVRETSRSCLFVYDLIYGFHMPLFAFLSGCSFALSEKRYAAMAPAAYFRKKAEGLAVPYLVINLLLFLFFGACAAIGPLEKLLLSMGQEVLTFGQWLTGLLSAGNPYCYPAWYLYGMMVYSAAAFAILRLFPQNRRRQLTACCIFSAAMLGLHFFTPLGARMGMRDITYFCLFFFLGWQMRGALPSCGVSWVFLGISLGVFVIDRIFGLRSRMPGVLFQTGRILAKSMTVLGFSGVMRTVSGRLEKLLLFLGNRTMEIYLFHQPLMTAVLVLGFYRILHLPVWPAVLLAASCATALSLAAGAVIRRLPHIRKLFSI